MYSMFLLSIANFMRGLGSILNKHDVSRIGSLATRRRTRRGIVLCFWNMKGRAWMSEEVAKVAKTSQSLDILVREEATIYFLVGIFQIAS